MLNERKNSYLKDLFKTTLHFKNATIPRINANINATVSIRLQKMIIA